MIIRSFAGMAELADAPDLGSGGRPCRFKSCYPHDFRVFETFEMFQRSCFFAFDSNGKNKEFKNFFCKPDGNYIYSRDFLRAADSVPVVRTFFHSSVFTCF